ncbi:MAG TPA: carbohydrate kinase [Candidatus Dormibacteraeota bacterium]|nr:carbohydrate kinase [Candidatus Dormibacteraeota bacterium]
MVVVCGEALIDMLQAADGGRRPVPGGGPFNTARALARLGVPAAFLGRLSTDAFGRRLAALLAADGVSLELASVGPERTTVAVADVDRAGVAEYRFELDGTSAPNLTADAVPEHLPSGVTAIHVGTLGLVLDPMAETLLGLVERDHEGRVVMLDPNIRTGLIPDGEYRSRVRRAVACSSIVKASESDVAWLFSGMAMQDAARMLRAEGVALVVITLGAAGAFAVHGDFEVSVEAPAVQVVDTIGAGDAFGAALLAWLHDHGAMRPEMSLERPALEEALRYACMAAAVTCSRAGADPPWKAELSPTNLRE